MKSRSEHPGDVEINAGLSLHVQTKIVDLCDKLEVNASIIAKIRVKRKEMRERASEVIEIAPNHLTPNINT